MATVAADTLVSADEENTMTEVPVHNAGTSLPAPEEVRGKSKATRSCRIMPALVIGAFVVAIALGVSLGVTQSRKRQQQQVASPPISGASSGGGGYVINHKPENDSQKAQQPSSSGSGSSSSIFDEIVTYLSDQGVSTKGALTTSATAQNQAARWLAEEDEYQLEIPSVGIDQPQGYHYATRYVLALLWFATDGPSWSHDFGFLSARDHCLWNDPIPVEAQENQEESVSVQQNTLPGGVYCETPKTQFDSMFGGGKAPITNLFLDHNDLNGPLPREIKTLTSLLSLNLGFNSIKSDFAELCHLTQLRSLALEHNRIAGELPDCLSDMVELRELFLSDNSFTGPLPDLSRLQSLKALKVDENDLAGPLSNFNQPKELQFLFISGNTKWEGTIDSNFLSDQVDLKGIDASGCQLGGSFPAHLLAYPDLESIDLHSNVLAGDLSELAIPDNDSLRYLAIHDNLFTGAIPASITNLKQLKHLDLSNNSFSGPMPAQLGSMKRLEYLFMADTAFDAGDIPADYASLNNLEELSLKSTNRNGQIPAFLGNLQRLVLLDLDNNNLSGPIPDTLGQLKELQFLLINRNANIAGAIPDSFSQLSKLRVGFFDRTLIATGFETLCKLPNFDNSLTNDMEGNEALAADCAGAQPQADCACCRYCCEAGGNNEATVGYCHKEYRAANLDPEWESMYGRYEFEFGNGEITYSDLHHINDHE